MLEKMKYLRIALPEDIEKAKLSGDFDRTLQMINDRLADEKVPFFMKERLILEKEIISRLPGEYPFDEKEALAMIQKEIPDFTKEELDAFMDRGDADWHMVNGERHLLDRFYASMKKVFPDVALRAGEEPKGSKLLDENVKAMKENGLAEWRVHLKHTLRINEEAFRKGSVLVHLPVPAECLNMKDIRILKTEPENAYIAGLHAGMRTVSFKADLEENRDFSVEYEYTSIVHYNDPDPKDAAVSESAVIRDEEPVPVQSELIRTLAKEIAGDETNPLIKAKRFYEFVTEHVVYSFMRQYITLGHIPDYCAARLRGDCGVQALLFIALCRSAGIPAKWQSGKFVTPEDIGNHDWALFYVEPWGWMFADCSFGGAAYRANAKERHQYYFGNLDPFRMAANNTFLAEFDPPKKHWRIDPYDNQSGEAEYEDRGLRTDELTVTCEVIQMTKVR